MRRCGMALRVILSVVAFAMALVISSASAGLAGESVMVKGVLSSVNTELRTLVVVESETGKEVVISYEEGDLDKVDIEDRVKARYIPGKPNSLDRVSEWREVKDAYKNGSQPGC